MFVPNISDGKGKIIKFEFNDDTIIPLKVIEKMDITESIVSPPSDLECIFEEIIRDHTICQRIFTMVYGQ